MEHPFGTVREAMQWSVVRAACYFGAWCLGLRLPAFVTRVFFAGIPGAPGIVETEDLATMTFSLVVHPLGWCIGATNLVLFAVFVRFEPSYRWVHWPLFTAIFWAVLWVTF